MILVRLCRPDGSIMLFLDKNREIPWTEEEIIQFQKKLRNAIHTICIRLVIQDLDIA